MKRVIHYFLGFFLLVLYGTQVCPFLDSLTLFQLALPIGGLLAFQAFLVSFIQKKWVATLPPQLQAIRIFSLELFFFTFSGIVLTIFNIIVYQFPLGSGMKEWVGFFLLGFFVATDLTLAHGHQVALRLEKEGVMEGVRGRFISIPFKLASFLTISIFLITAVMFLVINKDLEWMASVGGIIPPKEAQKIILGEFAFIFGVILTYISLIVYGYTRNLKGFLERERGALAKAASLEFGSVVPIASNDEFGQMAVHTNLVLNHLEKQVGELERTQEVAMMSLASLAETRDNETGQHILRTQRYVLTLASYLQKQPAFAGELDDRIVKLLFRSAPLHDIGKVGIPDYILLKPGKLTKGEFEIMKGHPRLGAEALAVAERHLGENSFLRFAREIALTHHENWDGSGYPQGLKGKDIPLSGRLMALADVYDALISKRVYKSAFTQEKAEAIILEDTGKKFDPDVVEAFQATIGEFKEIAIEYSDKKSEHLMEAIDKSGGEKSSQAPGT